MHKRKICVVTGTRADYSPLYNIIKELKEDNDIELQIIATCMHLSNEFGLTYRQIEEDGFIISAKIDMLISSDSSSSVVKSMGVGLISFADVFEQLKPDLLLILGDRFEILVAAQAALIYKIPVAHISGGELTLGAIDDSIRHSITKLSHLHFVANEIYRARVIQLGENPNNVYNYGDPSVEAIKKIQLYDKFELENKLYFKFGKINFLITYHPTTLSDISPEYALKQLFGALDSFKNASIIFTLPNADPGNKIIFDLIEEYKNNNPNRVAMFKSLGQKIYFSVLKYSDVVIGNSSSGIVEAPIFKKPSINIGKRQDGRLKSLSVIDCEENKELLESAINKAISKEFNEKIQLQLSPYEENILNVSKNIARELKNVNLKNIIYKKFYDNK